MKKFLIIAVALVFTVSSLQAQNKGVNFQDGTLKELLAKAGASNKYLFVDVYATWCAPCKYMATKVFVDETLGNYMNSTFINAKFDAESGEGIEVARQYRVEQFPTFLILNSEGKEVGRIIGGDEAPGFQKKVQAVVAKIK